jgi:hypothetical protein
MRFAEMRWWKIGDNNVRLATIIGLFLGATYCVIALLIFAMKGNQPFDRNSTTLFRTLGTYLIAFTSVGFIVGITLPLAKWMPGAALVGFLGAFCLWFIVGLAVSREPLLTIIKSAGVLGAAFGLPIGIGFWFQDRRFRKTGKW